MAFILPGALMGIPAPRSDGSRRIDGITGHWPETAFGIFIAAPSVDQTPTWEAPYRQEGRFPATDRALPNFQLA